VNDGERSLAIFIDFENLALGFQGRRERFDIARVLERLVEKGKIVAKKAYSDWSRFKEFTYALHEAAIELIEIPKRVQTGKNSADIRLCVDAMDLAYSKEHIDTFAIVSGDSDFSPLVSKLKELGKHVIGLGMQDSTSDLLRDNCDEFIYYEDLGKEAQLEASLESHLPQEKRKAFALLMEAMLALRRENKDVLWSSMIKDTMKRKKPSFNETYHGYRTFSELLEDAQREGILELETDKRSRTYVVTRFGTEMHAPREGAPPEGAVPPPTDGVQPLPMEPEAATVPPPGNGHGTGTRKKRTRRRRSAAKRQAMAVGNGSHATASAEGLAPPPPGPAPAPRPAPIPVEPAAQRPVPARAAPPTPPAPRPAPVQPTRPATPPPAPVPTIQKVTIKPAELPFGAGLDEPTPEPLPELTPAPAAVEPDAPEEPARPRRTRTSTRKPSEAKPARAPRSRSTRAASGEETPRRRSNSREKVRAEEPLPEPAAAAPTGEEK
jgi:uncharacterized protein (TIGR00288 family)